MNGKNVTCFDNFGFEYIQKEIEKFIGNKNITTSIYRIEAYDLIMWAYFLYWIYYNIINFTNKIIK